MHGPWEEGLEGPGKLLGYHLGGLVRASIPADDVEERSFGPSSDEEEKVIAEIC